MSNIAIIGGSGLYKLDGLDVKKKHDVSTPYGKTSTQIIEAQLDNKTCYFLSRHGEGHSISPSEVNYRANVFALKKLGVRYVVSISAVGSLKEEHNPKKFVLPSQFIDWTKGLRERTFFKDGIVGHVSVANPIELNLRQRLLKILKEAQVDSSECESYICIEGPQFSTKAESNLYRSMGADVIGMTNVPEAYLAKEAGIAYATIAMVTDYDCWKEEHCSLEEILKVMEHNNKEAHRIIPHIIESLSDDPPTFEAENQFSIVTSNEQVSQTNKELLEVLLKE